MTKTTLKRKTINVDKEDYEYLLKESESKGQKIWRTFKDWVQDRKRKK